MNLTIILLYIVYMKTVYL